MVYSSSMRSQTPVDETGMSHWENLPAPILIQIVSSLDPRSVVRVFLVCRRWSSFARDESVWRRLFATQWKKRPERLCSKCCATWMEEYKRLQAFSSFDCQTLEIDDEGWFVTFSPDGKKMASTTRAGSAFIWSISAESTGRKPSIVSNLEQRLLIQEQGRNGGYECYVCCFSPDSRYLLLTAVKVGVPVQAAGTAFVLDVKAGMKQVGIVDNLVFHLTSAMAWVNCNSFVGCLWDPLQQILSVNMYSALSTITTKQLCSFDCGPTRAIKSVVHIRVYRMDGKNCYRLLAVVCPEQYDASQHQLWGFKVPVTSNFCPTKVSADSGRIVDLDCLVCGMDLTPSRRKLVMACMSWPKILSLSLRDVHVRIFDPLQLTCLQSLPPCQLVLMQCHLFVGVNEDYLSW